MLFSPFRSSARQKLSPFQLGFTQFLVILFLLFFVPRIGLAQLLDNERVQYPSPEIAFICGPQLKSGSALNPFPSFDITQISKGHIEGVAFPAIGPRTLTGTVSITNGSLRVSGSGTKFTTEVDPLGPAPLYNGWLRVLDGASYSEVRVASVETDASMTLVAPWTPASVSGDAADTFHYSSDLGSWNYDLYYRAAYYDSALVQYINYYRTGDAAFLQYARKIADSWWNSQWINAGTFTQGNNYLPPRAMAFAGLMLRAMDGKPEYWDYLQRNTRGQFDNWVLTRVNDSGLYYDIREDGYAQLYAVMMARVLPDSYSLYANGTNQPATGIVSNGAVLRAGYLADVENTAVNFFGRLQKADGSWRFNVPDENVIDVEQPFMTGLYLESAVLLHQLTIKDEVKTSLVNQITKSAMHLYNDAYDRGLVTNIPPYRWRAPFYYWGGGTVAEPNLFNPPAPRTTAPNGTDDITSARQGNSTLHHAFGYAYFITGDSIYKTMGDDLFGSSFGDSIDTIRNLAGSAGAKEYDQNFRASGRYLVWRLEGASTPTPTPTPVPPSTSVTFVQLDTTTKGDWENSYGANGYNTVNDSVSYPSYAQVGVTGYSSPTWMASTTDVRGLQKAAASDRIAARWDSNSLLSIDLNLTDGATHQIAIYGLDWDGNNRTQRVDVLDWGTNALLDSRTISSFNGGQYLVWDIRGHVKITVNKTGGKSAVVSGLYFGGPVATPTPTPTPTPAPITNLGKHVGQAKRTGQNLANQLLSTNSTAGPTSSSDGSTMDQSAMTAMGEFVSEVQQACLVFNVDGAGFPAAARINDALQRALEEASQANRAATQGDLAGVKSHLREAINNLELSDVLITYGDVANPIDVASYMVRQQYVDFLNREPDQSGGDFWVNQIASCGTDSHCVEVKRINVSAAFFLSIEFQQTGYYVYRLYKSSYGRVPVLREFLPDNVSIASGVIVGADGWEARLAGNKQAFVQGWVQRVDFQALYAGLTNEQYVDTLIANVGVTITAAERNDLVQDLVNGASRADVLGKLVENPTFSSGEFNSAFVLMQYFGYLGRDPDTAGFNFWLNKLNQFDGDFVNAEMVKAFLNSAEYRHRFGL